MVNIVTNFTSKTTVDAHCRVQMLSKTIHIEFDRRKQTHDKNFLRAHAATQQCVPAEARRAARRCRGRSTADGNNFD